MSVLQIIGLCLLSPFLVCLLVGIIETAKEDPIGFVACVVCVMALVGAFLLLFGM